MFIPIQLFADWIVSLFFSEKNSPLATSINFFIYDSIKIMLLLIVIMFVVHFIKSFFPAYKIKQILSSKFSIGGNFLAAILGIITPFCSCSAIPLFIGLVESGVPLGVTFSYLVSAPMINEVALILLLGLFGWKVAAIYLISGLVIAVLVGVIIGKMNLENLVENYVWEKNIDPKRFVEQKKDFSKRIHQSWKETFFLFKKIFIFILIGVGIGAIIHGYVPENLVTKIIGQNDFWAVPTAVIAGVPLYSNAVGIIPIVQPLIDKGLPIGTALAFMMSVTALSLPEMIILKKILKPKLLFIYILIITVGIIFTGYFFNLILK